MKRVPLLFISVALVAGCASSPETKHEPEPKTVETKQQRVTRDLTLSWDNMGRGGAAVRQPAYIHVLGEGNLYDSGSKASIPKTDAANPYTPSNIAEAVDAIDSAKKQKPIVNVTVKDSSTSDDSGEPKGKEGYSLYEFSRWERFCDGGKGMNEADWRFVTRHGGEANVPDILQGSCAAPEHDYKAYLAAWTGFCTGTEISSFQRDIVRESVRPKSRVNPCAALSK